MPRRWQWAKFSRSGELLFSIACTSHEIFRLAKVSLCKDMVIFCPTICVHAISRKLGGDLTYLLAIHPWLHIVNVLLSGVCARSPGLYW